MTYESETTWGCEVVSKHVVISGASGLIGTELQKALSQDGVRVTRLVRRQAQDQGERSWRPGIKPLDPAVLEGATAVVNLSGASIARVPWTRQYRKEIMSSRLQTTGALAAAIRALGEGAPHFISASAVGYYGDRNGELVTELDAPGTTFLADVCTHWEKVARSAGGAAQVTLLRTAPLLDRGGMLKPLIPLTKLGLAGPLGGGEQHWPWISLADEVRAIIHIINHAIEGPVNLASPTVVTANDIGRELARQLGRPYLLPVPRWALRTVLGADAADGLLLPDVRVSPDRLLESGFEFIHATPREAIAEALRF